MSSAAESKPNHLVNEKSPYLIQHMFNPVDWYPWGAEAFEKARREDKPILVSIGYSTCHWCHVMERESYENPQIAALMNQYLVNIKVDREERPDVDKIYMTAVTAMSGSGGWPLNVFLTTDLKPFYGGTYYPPASQRGVPGWGDVVEQIGTAWRDVDKRKKLLETGNQLGEALKQYAGATQAALDGSPEWLDEGFKTLKNDFDPVSGGFGGAPKFPMPVYHHFLLRYAARTRRAEARDMTLHTLREMAKGGIYDQIGGGFARYSTDARWHVPHFEKMLYDNAQLAVNYLEAYQASKDPELRQVARETLDYIARDMTAPGGGFFSAEDADSLPAPGASHKTEGAFYVWTKRDVMALLGDTAGQVFCFRYGVQEDGNAARDPHGEFKGQNILYAAHSVAETARRFKMSEQETARLLKNAKQILFKARAQRPRPHLDDKIISAWNGLMISAFARGYQILNETKDLLVAQKAARFLKANLYDSKTKHLYRRWREGDRRVAGIADDYAFVVQGLLDLYESDFDPAWLDWAVDLTETLNRRFSDPDKGGFFMTAEDQDRHLLIRIKEDQDNVEPAASSVAALNLLRLAQYTGNPEYGALAKKTLRAFGTTLKESPRAMPAMLAALDYDLSDPRQVVIAGRKDSPDAIALLNVLRGRFIPHKIVMLADGGAAQKALARRLPFIEGMKMINEKATAYLCIHYACKEPTNDPAVFEKQLDQ